MAGGVSGAWPPMRSPMSGEVNILLEAEAERRMSTAAFVQHIRPMVNKLQVPGAKMPVMQMKVKGIRQIGVQAVEVKVQGTDVQDMYAFARALASGMSERPQPGQCEYLHGHDQARISRIYRRARAFCFADTVERVATTLRTLVTGLVPNGISRGAAILRLFA